MFLCALVQTLTSVLMGNMIVTLPRERSATIRTDRTFVIVVMDTAERMGNTVKLRIRNGTWNEVYCFGCP